MYRLSKLFLAFEFYENIIAKHYKQEKKIDMSKTNIKYFSFAFDQIFRGQKVLTNNDFLFLTISSFGIMIWTVK